jgi:hypothetical protein
MAPIHNWKQELAQYMLAYFLWAVAIALAVLAAMVARETYLLLVALNPIHRYTAHAINNFLVLLLGLLVLGLIVFAEHYYRTAVPQGRLAARFARLTMVLVGVIATLHTVRVIALASAGALTLVDPALTVLEWIIVAALARYNRRAVRGSIAD